MTRKRCELATSFTTAEVDALLELHRRMLRGAKLDEALALALRPGVLSIVRKFQLMEAKQLAYERAQLEAERAHAPAEHSS